MSFVKVNISNEAFNFLFLIGNIEWNKVFFLYSISNKEKQNNFIKSHINEKKYKNLKV
jgi:hypothetical protein